MRVKKALFLGNKHRRFKLLQGFGILKVKDNAEPLSQWPPATSMMNRADIRPRL
jgi:hypothetical protein